MRLPTTFAPHQAGFATSALRPGPGLEDGWPGAEASAALASRGAPVTARMLTLPRRAGRLALRGAGSALSVWPRHRLAGGALCGAEIALALPQAGGGPVLSAWLLRASCEEAQAWRGAGPDRDLSVTVALPPRAAHDGTLRAQTRAAVSSARLPAHLLDVALSAADLAEAAPEVLLLLSALHDVGVGVSMDGFSGTPPDMQALRSLPLTTVRLAACLTREVAHSAESRGLVAEAVLLAHRAGARVAALDVRTSLSRDILADLGCDEAQGPLFALPLPPAAFRRALVGQMEHQAGH